MVNSKVLKGGVSKKSLKESLVNALYKLDKVAFTTLGHTNPIYPFLTTKYSKLPINARILLRQKAYPYWDITEKDLTKKEISVLKDLARLSTIREDNRTNVNIYPVENDVAFNPDKYKDNKAYQIAQWGNEILTGKELKDYARDLYSDGIEFHDYASLPELKNEDGSKRYTDKQMEQLSRFTNDNNLQRIKNSFTNPAYAIRTAFGRMFTTPYGDKNKYGFYDKYKLEDLTDYQPINNEFFASDSYKNLHKYAERTTYPLKVRIMLEE